MDCLWVTVLLCYSPVSALCFISERRRQVSYWRKNCVFRSVCNMFPVLVALYCKNVHNYDPSCCQIRTVCRKLSGPETRSFSLLPKIESTLQRATESIKFIIFKTSHTNNALNQFNPFRAILLQPPGWLPLIFTVSKQKSAPRVSYDCPELRTRVSPNKIFFFRCTFCALFHIHLRRVFFCGVAQFWRL